MSENEITFEKALIELEDIVAKLESTDVPLEKAIDYYQAGMKLSKLCDEKLTDAQDKMTLILKDENKLEPFVDKEE